jgi:hypothetical protein
MGACQARQDSFPPRVLALLRTQVVVSGAHIDIRAPRVSDIERKNKMVGGHIEQSGGGRPDDA